MEQLSILDLDEDALIQHATKVLEKRLRYRTGQVQPIQSPADARRLAALRLAGYEHEVFAVFFLDNRHRLIAFEEMFRGTIDSASVHPREVVKEALARNAAAVILAHNHPSGVAEPSSADERITRRLREALALVDIRLLDHLVVGEEVVSMAERGLV